MSTRPRRSEYAKYWGLDPNITFLNHGSFGACPTEVLEYQSKLRLQIEKDPVRFFEYECLPLWHDAIESLSGFINANPEGMTFQNNATAGVNSVLRSLKFERGDEIIVPNHAYQACWNAIEFTAKRWGAKVIVVDIPFIVEEDDQIIELILTAITERTKLALIDTVTSPTGMRMPFERLVTEIQGRGVDVLLDAAHGPGIVPLNLEKLDVAYMTGNCHSYTSEKTGNY